MCGLIITCVTVIICTRMITGTVSSVVDMIVVARYNSQVHDPKSRFHR